VRAAQSEAADPAQPTHLKRFKFCSQEYYDQLPLCPELNKNGVPWPDKNKQPKIPHQEANLSGESERQAEATHGDPSSEPDELGFIYSGMSDEEAKQLIDQWVLRCEAALAESEELPGLIQPELEKVDDFWFPDTVLEWKAEPEYNPYTTDMVCLSVDDDDSQKIVDVVNETKGVQSWFQIRVQQMREAQHEDMKVRALIGLLKGEELDPKEFGYRTLSCARSYFGIFKGTWFMTNSGVLGRRRTKQEAEKHGHTDLIILPVRYQQMAMYMAHDGVAHRGEDKTLHVIRRKFDWCGLKADINDWVASCPTCQHMRPQSIARYPLKSIESGFPNQLIQIDHLSLCTSQRGNTGVLVVVDHFSKYAEAYPVDSYTSEETIRQLTSNWFARWGTPVALQSDNGPAFRAMSMEKFLAAGKVFGCKQGF
jgi:hypothetical protein